MEQQEQSLLSQYNSATVLASLLYYTATMLLGRCLRSAVLAALGSGRAAATLAPYALDFVTALQVCACSLENATVRRQYGMLAYLAVLFCLSAWHSASLPLRACAANPCRTWRRFARGEASLAEAAGRMACQLAGGQVAFRYARAAWSVGLCGWHGHRLLASASCSTDLTVSLGAGFGLEFLGVFADSALLAGMGALVALRPGGLQDWLLRPAWVQRLVVTLVGTGATYYGLYLTGMYANPANASAQTLGCRGTSVLEHALVYWVAPLLATSLGHRLEESAAAVVPLARGKNEKSE